MVDQARSPRPRPTFIAGALLLPVVLFVLLECGLRMVGFSGSDRLFIANPDLPGSLQASPDVMRRYMATAGGPAAWIDPFPFQASKPRGGLRLVVQGGSTAAGFPYGRWGGLAGMLTDRLEAVRPDERIEVVSTAMAAVNSYTLNDLVDEIIEIEPDAVLVYAGHNEYLGALGVGSSLGLVTSRDLALLQIRMSRSRVVQLVQRGIVCVGDAVRMLRGRAGDSLFERAAAASRIPFASDRYDAGLAQFESNIGELLARYQAAGIPVYIGTLVSNERDLPPFEGGPGEGVDGAAWSAHREALEAAWSVRDPVAIRRSIDALLALDENAADPFYALGQLELLQGRPEKAREALQAARDRDALRFRAPSVFNDRLRALAKRHGARVVEVEAHFRDASRDGLIGRDLLIEHVHPNADGYFLLADAFFEALRQDGLLGEWAASSTRARAHRDMPITEVDRLVAGYRKRLMTARFPFTDSPRAVELPEPTNEIERLARASQDATAAPIEILDQLLQYYVKRGRLVDAARVARLGAHGYPAEHGPNLVAGKLLLEVGQPERARFYLERSLRAVPDDVGSLAASLRADRALGDAASARRHAAALAEQSPHHPLLEGSRDR